MVGADELRRLTFARHVEIHDTLGSTNDRALELARDDGIELPALVVARLQTAGRGRGPHSWWAADGALTFSLVLDELSTGIAPASWPQLSLTTAVAVCDTLAAEIARHRHSFETSATQPSSPQSAISNPQLLPLIKWPNDVLVARRKICGILVESPGGAAPAKNRVVVGVGININNSWRGATSAAGENGTALCDVTGKQHDLVRLLVELVAAVDRRIEQLGRRETNLIHTWQRLNVFKARQVIVEIDGRHTEGTCEEIANDGRLVLKTASGLQRLSSGSARFA